MHGRLKVKSTAEQQEAKRKEREKKLKIYNAATSKIFKKKQDGELDEELLTLTGEVLTVNPDFYTLWNYRKETFLKLFDLLPQDILQKMYENELYFLEACLKINPKSYGTWHHRCFVMDHMPQPNWARELELCNQFLTYDERNFHCWDYRRFVVKNSNVTPQSEFDYSMGKISNNFSNYSSWHYRSKLLPIIYPDPSQPMGVTEKAILNEYNLVQNGFFTDPDDQSNWFYHRWLMGRGEQNKKIASLTVSRHENIVLFSLSKAIQIYFIKSCNFRNDPKGSSIIINARRAPQLNKNCIIDLQINGEVMEGVQWFNHLNNQTFSTTWLAENIKIPKGDSNVKLTVNENDCIVSATLELHGDEEYEHVYFADESGCSMFSAELSAVKNETLQQELDSIQQLMELETDNKWAALTEVLIMKGLDPLKYNQNIMTSLEKLEALDFKRKNYYRDLRSKFIIENAIDALKSAKDTSSLILKDQKLTKLCHPDLLSFIRILDLSQNQLSSIQHFSHLQNLRCLTLDNNNINSCNGLENLRLIETISLQGNDIRGVDNLKPLQECTRLKTLYLKSNPICEVPSVADQIKEIIPDVDAILS